MADSKPLVSICIPTYNRAGLLKYTLESCIRQTYENLEIVVADNASTDATSSVVEEYQKKDARIKYVRNETNIGSGRNFLKAAESAVGVYFQALGDDDWLSRNYVEEAVHEFEKHPEVACVFTNIIALNYQGEGKPVKFLDQDLMDAGIYAADWFFKNAFSHPHLGGKGFISFMRRRDFIDGLKEALAHPENLLDRGAMREVIDSTVFWRILEKYKTFCISKEMAYVKLVHGTDHVGLQGDFFKDGNPAGFIAYVLQMRKAYELFYRTSVPRYFGKMRRFFAVALCARVIRMFFLREATLKTSKDKILPMTIVFLKDYSIVEKWLCVLELPRFLITKVIRSIESRRTLSVPFVPDRKYFLDKDYFFKAE